MYISQKLIAEADGGGFGRGRAHLCNCKKLKRELLAKAVRLRSLFQRHADFFSRLLYLYFSTSFFYFFIKVTNALFLRKYSIVSSRVSLSLYCHSGASDAWDNLKFFFCLLQKFQSPRVV